MAAVRIPYSEFKMELTNTLATPQPSAFNALVTMFYDPVRAFGMLERRTAAWLPLLLIMGSAAAMIVWYFSFVDFAWFQDQLLTTIKDAESREQARKVMTEGMVSTSTLAAGVLTLPVVCVILAVYFMIVGNFINKEISFSGAFALSAWASVPSLLLLPLGAIQILLAANGQVGFSELNPLSLNQLFFQYEMSHPMAAVLDSLSFTSVLGIVLLVIGFEVWTKVSRATALMVVLPPYVLFYGAWLAYAMSQTA